MNGWWWRRRCCCCCCCWWWWWFDIYLTSVVLWSYIDSTCWFRNCLSPNHHLTDTPLTNVVPLVTMVAMTGIATSLVLTTLASGICITRPVHITLVFIWNIGILHIFKWNTKQVKSMSLWRSLIHYDITSDTAITAAESESDIRITTDTPYLALTGELWGVCCEDLGENWPRYNGTALYVQQLKVVSCAWCGFRNKR